MPRFVCVLALGVPAELAFGLGIRFSTMPGLGL